MKTIAASWVPWLASAALLTLAFPPFNLWPLVFVALVPWLATLKHTSPKHAFWQGYGFGFVYFGYQMFWLIPFVGRWTGSLGLGLAPWFVCMFLAGWFYALCAWLMARGLSRGWAWAVPLAWAAIEAFRAYIPGLAFPWANISLPLAKFPALAQLGAFGTMFLVSAWVVVFNIGVAALWKKEGWDEGWKRHAQAALAVFFVGLGVSLVRYSFPSRGGEAKFTLGQPGVDMAFTTPDDEHRQLTAATAQILPEAERQGTRLLILPEGYAGEVYGSEPVTPLGPAPLIPVVMGAHRMLPESSYQTAFLWDGSKWSYADKTRLVVFGEYVPLREQLPFLKDFNIGAADISAATELKTLRFHDMKIGQLICFEGVFPDLAASHCDNGAQVLVQMSIDDWYESTPAYEQLWMSSIWRSIESGLPLLRVGARGKSLATDSRGNLVADVPVGVRAAQEAMVMVPSGSDAFGGRMGFLGVFWLSAVAVGVWPRRKQAIS